MIYGAKTYSNLKITAQARTGQIKVCRAWEFLVLFRAVLRLCWVRASYSLARLSYHAASRHTRTLGVSVGSHRAGKRTVVDVYKYGSRVSRIQIYNFVTHSVFYYTNTNSTTSIIHQPYHNYYQHHVRRKDPSSSSRGDSWYVRTYI